MKEPSTVRIGDQLRFSVELLREIKDDGHPILITVHDILEDADGVKTIVLRIDE